MDWIPAVKSHQISQYRWSNKHPVSIIQDLISPHVDNQDTSDLLPGVQIAGIGRDLVYVSSNNTVTVLLNVLESRDPEQCVARTCEKTEIAREVAILPNVADVQVFETQLSVCGISVGSDTFVILRTMYHVILLRKINGKYELELLHDSKEHILSVIEGHDRNIYILTTSTVLVWREGEGITPLLDISGQWRVSPVERATFLQYKQWFVVVEPSAIHFINETDHHMVCTIPTDYLDFTEKFLNVDVMEDKLVAVTSNYLLVYDISVEASRISLDMELKLSHNVADAHFAQFYPQLKNEPVAASSSNLIKFRFAVFSDIKCSFFTSEDRPDTDFITFLIPYKFVNMKRIERHVLDKSNYLNMTVDKRNNITQRINSGICGAFFSLRNNSHFLLNKHKDLFSDGPFINEPVGNEQSWNSWLSSISLEDQYWVDNHPVGDKAYSFLLNDGRHAIKTQTLEVQIGEHLRGRRGKKKREGASEVRETVDSEEGSLPDAVLHRPVPLTRDPVFEGVQDKYVNFLLDAWDWS